MTNNSPASLRLAVLISGGGTTLRNLICRQQAGNLKVDFRLVVSSNPAAKGLGIASEALIPTQTIQLRDHASPEAFSQAIFSSCREQRVDLVVMGGFLKHAQIPDDFAARVINIHPSLIPAFCGQGFYGLRVHQAVLDYGAKVTGCTVHFVDNQYDHGPVILQRTVPVLDDDTAETLARRVFSAECEALPEAIALFRERRLQVVGRRVRVLHEANSR